MTETLTVNVEKDEEVTGRKEQLANDEDVSVCVCIGGRGGGLGRVILFPISQVERNTSACGTNPTSVKIPLVANEPGGLGDNPTLSSSPFFLL